MYPMIDQEIIRQAEIEARRSGARHRRLREVTSGATRPRLAPRVDVLIREARPQDMLVLMQLADLDSHAMPVGHVLVAEAAGKIRAAMAVDDGALIADPFVATRQLQELLRLRAAQIREASRRERRGSRGLFGGLHLRPRRAV